MRFIWLFFGVLLVGCAGQVSGPETAGERPPPDAAFISAVPFFPQTTYQCGPAALAMVLAWGGLEILPDQLIPQVYTPGRKGSLQSSLIAAARRNSRLAYVIRGKPCLMAELAAGHPVLVLQNLGIGWWPRWHYAVAVGYDPADNQLIMHSGRQAWRRVGMRTFERTWRRADDWGLVVLNSGVLPACAEEHEYLKAAAGLEQSGAITAALPAYRSAAVQWPESAAVQFALGNALYAQGDRDGALTAFRHAVRIDPQNAPALNNLAHILAEQGLLEEAETAARRAIESGGAHRKIFQQTLEEIERRR